MNSRKTGSIKNNCKPDKAAKCESGFTLLEMTIALMLLLICALSVFAAFTYAVKYNAGNNLRSQTLSVFQQRIEQMRSAKFTPTIYNDPLLTGKTKTAETYTSPLDSKKYLIETIVDNDPFTAGIQTTGDATTKLKEITISVTPLNTSDKWVSNSKTTVVLRRTRAN